MKLQRLDELDCRAWDGAIFDCCEGEPDGAPIFNAGPSAALQEARDGFSWGVRASGVLERLLVAAKLEREARGR